MKYTKEDIFIGLRFTAGNNSVYTIDKLGKHISFTSDNGTTHIYTYTQVLEPLNKEVWKILNPRPTNYEIY